MEDLLTQWLRECQTRFGQPPRRFTPWRKWMHHRVTMPEWLTIKRWDRLTTLFWKRRAIFRHGMVVWGHIIQANSLLFEPGKDDCPGEVVFRLEATSDHSPQDLSNVASAIASLKHTRQQDPDLDRIATYLTHERKRVFGLPVPSSWCGYDGLLISTTFFTRQHFPGKMLTRSLLPMVVLPNAPQVALPLPAFYWPDSMVDYWRQA